MSVFAWLFGSLIVLLKLRMVFVEALFCAIPAIMTWFFVLGADPRVGEENRRLVPMAATVAVILVAAIWLFATGRFRPSPWLYVRAAQISAGISLFQLALIQPSTGLVIGLALLSVFVLVAGLVAIGRVLLNRRPMPMLDAALVYGSLAAVLIVSGIYHARVLKVEIEYSNQIATATLDTYHYLGRVPTQHRQLRDVRDWQRGFTIDGGEGIVLVAGDGAKLLVPGDESKLGSICEQLVERLPQLLKQQRGSFQATESHQYVMWFYWAAAVAFLALGLGCDRLSRNHSLTPDGRPDASPFTVD